jgi:hypothetical protein
MLLCVVAPAIAEELCCVVTAGAHGTDAPSLHPYSARSSVVVVVVAAVLTRAEPLTAAARKGY